MPKIYLSQPILEPSDFAEVQAAMESGWIAPVGPAIEAFEQTLSAITKKKIVALSSGTAAIHLGLKALGVVAGDLVIVPTLTFAASLNPILYLGAIPILVDVDEKSGNISIEALALCLTELKAQNKTPKAIIVVDLFGMPAAIQPIRSVYQNVFVAPIAILEDAAEALGSGWFNEKDEFDPCGSEADIVIWSFNGNKIISTSGGGALGSDNLEVISKVKKWATQSRETEIWYEHQEIGYNYRLSNLLAALGNSQLKRLDDLVNHRRKIYTLYHDLLSAAGLGGQSETTKQRSNRWLPVFKLPRHGIVLDVCTQFNQQEIECRPVWKPMHLQPYLASVLAYQLDILPKSRFLNAELWFSSGICLPSGPGVTESICESIANRLKQMLK